MRKKSTAAFSHRFAAYRTARVRFVASLAAALFHGVLIILRDTLLSCALGRTVWGGTYYRHESRARSDMNAVVFHEHGGPGKLQYQEMPAPTLGQNEVLVRVKACALNHLDV